MQIVTDVSLTTIKFLVAVFFSETELYFLKKSQYDATLDN